ncbi:MAG: hypothetical protein ASARMPRED_006723 [Alectoria sarmentosa]|nr:MAG: hypothetical protein ASARMPRED_006723 [Alectoria sarmentosa]
MAESAGKMYALATVLSILAIVAILLRFYARRVKQTALSWDDYVLLIALVCQLQISRNLRRNVLVEDLIVKQLFTIGTAICMFVGTAIGNLGQHTAVQADGSPVFDHRLRVFEQIFFASQLTQTLTFGFTKLSVLLFYKRTAGAGIAKLVILNELVHELNVGFLDISYISTPIVYWAMVESSLGIVGACLPMLRPLFVRASTSSKKRAQSPEEALVVVVIETACK